MRGRNMYTTQRKTSPAAKKNFGPQPGPSKGPSTGPSPNQKNQPGKSPVMTTSPNQKQKKGAAPQKKKRKN